MSRFEGFRLLKPSNLEGFRALKPSNLATGTTSTILTSGYISDKDEKKKEERLAQHKKVLESVLEVLEDEEKIKHILKQYDKENECIETYRKNRKERILMVLDIADVSPEDYVCTLKESSRKGINKLGLSCANLS